MDSEKTDLLIQENIPLAPLTTLQVGGAARFFVEAKSEGDIVVALEWADSKGIPVFILGGGSNLVVSDEGFDGLVIHIAAKGIEVSYDSVVTVQAGEDWDSFVGYCVSRNLQGLECLSGIPGTVGATPIQNVGAYGQEVSETIVSVRVLERESGEILKFSNADCGFAYRTSIFNTTSKDRFIVLSVKYKLISGGEPKIVYKDLRNHFGDHMPTLAETREAVIKIRAAKSMVIDPTDPNSRSAGSFFKNPIVSREKFDEVRAKASALGISDVPSFPADDGHVKIPAAWLIERSGFQKGYRLGNAGISANHTLAIINAGGASAQEIFKLKDEIQKGVEAAFKIALQPEPLFLVSK